MRDVIPISRPSIGEAERRAVMDVLDSGCLAQGARVAALEEAFAALCGVEHAVATSSGTTALHLALLAHGIGPGDEVITTPFSFVATVNAILYVGARPVFVDVEPHGFGIDATAVEQAVTPHTRAILPVHLYGQTCDMTTLLDVASRHDLVVIEDACQAVGAGYHGRRAGSFGTGVFSLYATKNLAAGEGGMITTDAAAIADRCRMLRSHGMRRRYEYEGIGFNFRLSDLHAAVALAQLDRFPELQERRTGNADWMNDRIHSVVTPTVLPDREHVWHQYTVKVGDGADRDDAVAQLACRGVGTGVFYPTPLHQLDHVRELGGEVSLPVAEHLAATVLSLPVHPELTAVDLELIVRAVNDLRSSPC